jgi:hypothetical protein
MLIEVMLAAICTLIGLNGVILSNELEEVKWLRRAVLSIGIIMLLTGMIIVVLAVRGEMVS